MNLLKEEGHVDRAGDRHVPKLSAETRGLWGQRRTWGLGGEGCDLQMAHSR